jgi:tRNA threonylcarbamoyladenosine biosynthesis protein TsaB
MLALDSSTEWCSVAVGDGRRWYGRDEHVGQSHSERLLPLARTMLAEAELALSQLDGIAFGAGPGSFTGIRISCGVAQGLALGADLPSSQCPRWKRSPSRRVASTDGAPSLRASMRGCASVRRHVYVPELTTAASRAWRTLMGPVAIPPAALRLPSHTGELYGAGNGYAAYPSLAADLGLAAVDRAAADGAIDRRACVAATVRRGSGCCGTGVASLRAAPCRAHDRRARSGRPIVGFRHGDRSPLLP